jgi:assimilatory nitrate reductase catalytic subunit
MASGPEQIQEPVRTTCPYCGVGCGVKAVPDGKGGAEITGDSEHPANFGRLCSKGSALGETLSRESRLLYPHIGNRRVSWDQAIAQVATEFARVRDAYGPESIAFYLSGQLLTEDYYVANKLAKGFLGTPHVDTNSRLCMASSVAGHKRAFGADVVPGCYEDLDIADLVILVGSNTAWCHPILYQRLQKARQTRGTRIVNIDPRRTATSEGCDLQLSLASGSDTCLWNGLLVYLTDNCLIDLDYIRDHTEGFCEALTVARERAGSAAKVALHTGLAVDDVTSFFKLWASTQRIVTCYSQGVNQSIQGTDKVNAIVNCHLATGRIGTPGCGPFSLTGQPNAMGGREVGGLANMLAAHMGFSAAERDIVQRFWNAPHLVTGEGHKAVDMFDAIDDGSIKALWIMGTNPAVSMPRADAIRSALEKLEFLALSEVVNSNDTLTCASVRLPAHGWGEKDGTVTNSERRISRQRAFVEPAGEARADWWVMCRVAERLGWSEAFAYASAAEIFAEHAALSAFENDGNRVFNIGGLSGLRPDEYDALQPIQWPVIERKIGMNRVFANARFATASGRARFVALARALDRPAASDTWPMLLNTGRIRDQWHTMTRTGLVARLSSHAPEPFAEINPADAAQLGIAPNSIVRIATVHGTATVRASISDAVASGTIFVPIHWSGVNSSAGRIGSLVHSAVDAISGQPDLKATPARISAVDATFFGYAISKYETPPLAFADLDVVYWARIKVRTGYVYTFAIDGTQDVARHIANRSLPALSRISYSDDATDCYRCAVFDDSRVAGFIALGKQRTAYPGPWLIDMFLRANLSAQERRALLAGGMPDGTVDSSPIVCVCHQVSAGQVSDAMARGCRSSEAVGKFCQAGTNCGSCLPEINKMLSNAAAVARRSPQMLEPAQ